MARLTVEQTPDWWRVYSLPRRQWSEEEGQKLAAKLTEELSVPGGLQKLRPLQAIALYEFFQQKGLFGPLRVGAGKTLITLLAASIIPFERPLLILPAALIRKTELEIQALSRHWRIRRDIRLVSYNKLGIESGSKLLDQWKPDLIIADEAHKLKNTKAAVTRRVTRYMKDNPLTNFIAVSGTMIKNTLWDFAHLLQWSLKEGAPVPLKSYEIFHWAKAMEPVEFEWLRKVSPGALLEVNQRGFKTDTSAVAAREAFQQRLQVTPGVVGSTKEEDLGCSLYISSLTYDTNTVTAEHFETLYGEWTTPCGWALDSPVDIWRHAKELALGFHYTWSPHPPEDWLDARRAWAKFVRDTLKKSEKYDSPLQVWNAVERGEIASPERATWIDIKDTFVKNQVAVWHDDCALEVCSKWAKHGGVIWVEHVEFGKRLSNELGLPFFQQGGLDEKKRSILHTKEKTIIASVGANSTGINLQDRYARNLVTSCPQLSNTWEQLIGRTHRSGQQEDTVIVDFLAGCAVHVEGWYKALENARAVEQTLGQSQKILVADKNVLSLEEWYAKQSSQWKPLYNESLKE